MADHTITRAAEVGGLGRGRGATDELRLRGFDRSHGMPIALESPIADPDLLYGTDLQGIRALEKRWPKLKTPISERLPYRMSHAVYAVREEMAVTLEDVLARRTRSLFLDAEEASAAAQSVARAVETHSGFEAGWAASEMAKLPAMARQFRPAS